MRTMGMLNALLAAFPGDMEPLFQDDCINFFSTMAGSLEGMAESAPGWVLRSGQGRPRPQLGGSAGCMRLSGAAATGKSLLLAPCFCLRIFHMMYAPWPRLGLHSAADPTPPPVGGAAPRSAWRPRCWLPPTPFCWPTGGTQRPPCRGCTRHCTAWCCGARRGTRACVTLPSPTCAYSCSWARCSGMWRGCRCAPAAGLGRLRAGSWQHSLQRRSSLKLP